MPELLVRRALHAAGLRYRLYRDDLPGRPDLVFPSRRLCLFVLCCFWHSCPRCRHGAREVKSNTECWSAKRARNKARDMRHRIALEAAGWMGAEMLLPAVPHRLRDREHATGAAIVLPELKLQLHLIKGALEDVCDVGPFDTFGEPALILPQGLAEAVGMLLERSIKRRPRPLLLGALVGQPTYSMRAPSSPSPLSGGSRTASRRAPTSGV